MALTENDIFELQLGIARTKASEPDVGKKAELQAQIDFYDVERARIISANNAQRIALLQPKLVRLEDIIRELGKPSLLVPVSIFRAKAGVPAPVTDPEPQPGPEPDPIHPDPVPGTPVGFSGPEILITETDLDALARVAQSEVEVFGNFGKDQLEGGAAAVVDTILNRVAHPKAEFPDSIVGVIDQPAQFSAINTAGSWTGLPKAKPSFFKIIKRHVEGRASGKASAIRGALHFLNPNTASADSLSSWGKKVVENPIARFGDVSGHFVHLHGFAEGYQPPPDYAIEYKGRIAWFDGRGMLLSVMKPDTVADVFELPPAWKPAAPMKRIICHWTAGAHKASGLDKFHYHVLIEADGNVVRGDFSIADNVSNLVWDPRSYAAHTKGTNTGSIGVSVCCMANAKEKPFKAGASPMTQVQWARMIEVVADLCRSYDIRPTPETVLGHGEVEKNLGRKQDGKWDPMVLPWNRSLSKQQVGAMLREQVNALL